MKAVLLAVFLALAGCGFTLKNAPTRAHAALDFAAKQGLRAISVGCKAEADKCRASGASQPSCKGWLACDKTRVDLDAATRKGEAALLLVKGLLETAEKKGWVK